MAKGKVITVALFLMAVFLGIAGDHYTIPILFCDTYHRLDFYLRWYFWIVCGGWLGCVVVLMFRSKILALLAVLVSPFLVTAIFSCANGVCGYCTGTARLRTVGLPGPGFFNLDRTYRCYRSTSGCVVNGSEQWTHMPYNAAVVGLIKAFGPMPGAYTGPYPTGPEADSLLRASEVEITPEQLRSGLFTINEVPVHLTQETVKQAIEYLGDNGSTSFKASTIGGQCLLLAGSRKSCSQGFLLIDIGHSQLFAHLTVPRDKQGATDAED